MITNFRKAIVILLALTFAAFALPVVGQTQKAYTLTMEVPFGVVDVNGNQQVIATIKNQSTPVAGGGASNIGSLDLAVGTAFAGLRIAEGLSLVRLDSNGVPAPITATVTADDGQYPTRSIAITSINGNLKGLETLIVTMYIDGCGIGSTWSALVYTGPSLNGNQFSPSTKPGQASQFGTDVPCGTIACGITTVVGRDDITSPNVTVTRGPYNSDGTCNIGSDPTRFFVNNRLGTSNRSVQLSWPVLNETDSEPEAAFEFDANVTATAPLKLAFKNYASTSTPAFLLISANPALTCSASNSALDWFPRPHGLLLAAFGVGATKIKVGTTGTAPYVNWPTVFPANFIIDDELMVVTKINTSNNTWTVLPGTAPHGLNARVMYTPLKRFTAADQRVCTGPGSETNACPYNTVGELAKSCLIPTSTDGAYRIIGIGDPIWSGGD